MKNSIPFYTFAALLCAFFSLPVWGGLGWGQSYQWAKNIGSTNDDYGYSIAVDASGNVYISGSWTQIVAFGGTLLSLKKPIKL